MCSSALPMFSPLLSLFMDLKPPKFADSRADWQNFVREWNEYTRSLKSIQPILPDEFLLQALSRCLGEASSLMLKRY